MCPQTFEELAIDELEEVVCSQTFEELAIDKLAIEEQEAR
jgi:hypothetical protein